jgi:outer membrane protein assembly factor BamB
LFVTGESANTGFGIDFATIAYRTATGAQEWLRRYPGGDLVSESRAAALVVNPDGTRLFVTGSGFRTVAYGAATGAEIWTAAASNSASWVPFESIAISPSGNKVVVVGGGQGADSWDLRTVTYGAATGAELWSSAYDGNPGGSDFDYGVAVGASPDGSTFVATGLSTALPPNQKTGRHDYVTVAYEP